MCIKIGLTTFETIVMEMPPKKKKIGFGSLLAWRLVIGSSVHKNRFDHF